jgi:phage terminase small subunit
MSSDAEALWDCYVPILAEGGVLEQVDGLGLAQAFEAYVLAMRARDVVGDSPVIEDDPYNDGRVVLKKHPGVTAWKDAVGVLRGLLADYGLQPLGRTRLGDALRQPGVHGPLLPDGAPAVFQPRVVGDD